MHAATQGSDAMTVTKLECIAKRMRQHWYDLVMAEQQGCPQQVLERLYSSYLLTVEEYNRCADYRFRINLTSASITAAGASKRIRCPALGTVTS